MVDRLREVDPFQRPAYFDPQDRAADVVPDEAAAGGQLLVHPQRVAEDVDQVMGAVDESEVERGQPWRTAPYGPCRNGRRSGRTRRGAEPRSAVRPSWGRRGRPRRRG